MSETELKRSYVELLRAYPRLIFVGVYHTFFSTFGQTVLMAVYVQSIMRDFALSAASYAAIYGGVTIFSAVLLPFSGPRVDRIHLRRYSCACGVFLALGCLILSQADSLSWLIVGLLLVRHGGQALLPLCASTTIARYFTLNRGKALSLSNLGFAIGEAILPMAIVKMIAISSWQKTYLLVGWVGGGAMVILSLFFIRSADQFAMPPKMENNLSDVEGKSPAQVLRSPYFYAIQPALLAAPFVMTALFFFQAEIAHGKGWSLAYVTSAISAFAVMRFLFSILGGPLVDLYTARKMLAISLMPLILALIFLRNGYDLLTVVIFWGLCGASVGLGSTIKQAIWAEVYGTLHLGGVKSLSGPLTVLSTALSPYIFGVLLDNSFKLEQVYEFCILGTAAAALLSLVLNRA